MIELSSEYKNNIVSMFPDIGSSWLERVPGIINKYIEKFNLTDVKVGESLTYNVLLFAKSKEYGDVVLKVEIPFEEMTIRESGALELNNGIGACKCYFKNIKDGVLLIEKLNPGTSLNEEHDLEKRIKVFSEVSNLFSVKVNEDTDLPTYTSIFNRSLEIVANDKKYDDIKDIVSLAKEQYEILLSKKEESNYLLHSDLYSDNIIMSKDGYKAIDPHGFIGPRVLDTAIIAQKELDKIGYTSDNYDYMFDLLSNYCGYEKEDIVRAFFVNYVLNICWDREVNIINDQSLSNAYDIYNYLTKNKKLSLQNKEDND